MNLIESKSPVFIVGPALSGKSSMAHKAIKEFAPADVLGSCNIEDPLYQDRISTLQQMRPKLWKSHDSYHHLLEDFHKTESHQVIIDSASQWLASILMEAAPTDDFQKLDQHLLKASRELVTAIENSPKRIIIVSAESGYDFAPNQPIRRILRTRACELNRHLGRISATVIQAVAGLPLLVKPSP